MAENSKIEWTDATVNFWWGCTKVGPGCDHCYAETWSKRTGETIWGVGAPRRKIKGAVALMHRLDNGYSEWAADFYAAEGNARALGLPPPNFAARRRVFVQSMADLFDTEVPVEWFAEAWQTIERCDRLSIQIVTKRLTVIEKRLAAIGRTSWPGHAGLLITVVSQAEVDRDAPRLLELKEKLGIPWVGLSMEPLLGPVNLRDLRKYNPRREPWIDALRGSVTRGGLPTSPNECGIAVSTTISELPGLDWVIVGGESGPGARPMHPDWARSLRDQCAAATVPFHFKQWGEWIEFYDRDRVDPDWRMVPTVDNQMGRGAERFHNLAGGLGFHGERVVAMRNVGKKAAGRLLDGVTHDGYPEVRHGA